MSCWKDAVPQSFDFHNRRRCLWKQRRWTQIQQRRIQSRRRRIKNKTKAKDFTTGIKPYKFRHSKGKYTIQYSLISPSAIKRDKETCIFLYLSISSKQTQGSLSLSTVILWFLLLRNLFCARRNCYSNTFHAQSGFRQVLRGYLGTESFLRTADRHGR